jgi:hypothetical protein
MSWLDRLHHHPFAVDAYFDFSLVLTYALPARGSVAWTSCAPRPTAA